MGKDEVIKIVSKYSEEVRKIFSVEEVILYGSYAKNNAKENSDIDVAIIVKKITNGLLNSEFLLHKLVRKYDLRIEPVLFEKGNDPSGLLEEIKRTGIIIYQTN
jgi:predicted nucleotidyltransferase